MKGSAIIIIIIAITLYLVKLRKKIRQGLGEVTPISTFTSFGPDAGPLQDWGFGSFLIVILTLLRGYAASGCSNTGSIVMSIPVLLTPLFRFASWRSPVMWYGIVHEERDKSFQKVSFGFTIVGASFVPDPVEIGHIYFVKPISRD